ncbi:MAG: nicotinate (nicotinamide) nucleotide adenylyltransferase [Chlamydiia bacterium]
MRGIYIGTFDPVHHGHVHLAVSLAEAAQLSEILVIPAHCSPTKLDHPPLPIHHRIAMAEKAFKPFPFIRVLDLEAQRPAPSYTIDTLRELERQGMAPMRLLLGSEVARTLHSWRSPEAIIELAPPIVWTLRESHPARPWPNDPISRACQAHLVELPEWECSSTQIRARVRAGLTCAHLVPASVWHYILEHGLYEHAPNPVCEVDSA